MQTRNAWVDYAKAIGIILVVYGHVARGVFNAGLPMDGYWFALVDSIIYSFHMPLFFFLSGLFFYDSLQQRGSVGLITTKIDTIVYPFIVWSLLQGGCEVALSTYTNGQVSLAEVLAFAWQPRAQFWFLHTLFLIFVLCTCVYAKVARHYFLPVLLLFALLYLLQQQFALNALVNLLLANAVFFALGVWFNEVKGFFEVWCRQLMLLFGSLFLLGQYVFHIGLGLNYQLGGPGVLALATISIAFVTTLSMCLGRLRLNALLLIGASSMSIYLMHILAGSGVRIVLDKLLGIDALAVHLLLGTLLGIAGPLLAQALIDRYQLRFLLSAPRALSVQWLLTPRLGRPKTPL
jgi:fucose 4-O-acetylase-like acetyltransferase